MLVVAAWGDAPWHVWTDKIELKLFAKKKIKRIAGKAALIKKGRRTKLKV
jgi:hypothetical protein